MKQLYGPSSTQLRADIIFTSTLDEFVGDDFYWSHFSWSDFTGYHLNLTLVIYHMNLKCRSLHVK